MLSLNGLSVMKQSFSIVIIDLIGYPKSTGSHMKSYIDFLNHRGSNNGSIPLLHFLSRVDIMLIINHARILIFRAATKKK